MSAVSKASHDVPTKNISPSCHDVPEEELLKSLDVVIDGFSTTEGALIPVLQSAQNLFGYLPVFVLKHISTRLHMPYSQVTGTVTFYSFFSTVPRGKYVVRVCLGTACYVRGGKEVVEAMKKTLGIDVGGTTGDRMFSLEVGRCFGACGLAPVVMVGEDVHRRVKPSKVGQIIEEYYKAARNSAGVSTPAGNGRSNP